MPTPTARLVALSATAVVASAALLVGGCSPAQPAEAPPAAPTVEGGDTNSCLAAFDYKGRRYGFLPADQEVPFEVAEQTGQATIPPCFDGGPSQNGTPVAQQIPAYRIDGLDPEDAFAIGPPERARMVAVLGERLPPAVEKFIEHNS